MTAHHPPLSVTPLLAGEPVRLGPEVATLDDLLRALGQDQRERSGLLVLAPAVGLVHALTGSRGSITLRWAVLPHAPRLAPEAPPLEVVLVLGAGMEQSGAALRVVSRLAACLRDPTLRARARAAETREALQRLLAEAEMTVGESPLGTAELLALLGTAATGLAPDEAARRVTLCGPNRLERVRRRPLALRFLEQFLSFFATLLWVAGACAFLAGMPELGWAVFAVIIVNGVFSFFQEYRAEHAIEALQELLPHQITVIRDGQELRLPTSGIVPGDVIRLEEGDQVPADGQLLAAAALRVDQSALTGESHPAFKLPAVGDERENVPRLERHELLFAGTSVVAGSGTLAVTATGMASAIGSIAHLTQTVTEEPSPLQREMVTVTRIVTLLATSFGIAFFVLGVTSGALALADGLVLALGVIVANVPEGLLPTLTLALALGVQRMARQRCLVKRLSAVEALGATTVICTDKTGTLTENRMAVRSVWCDGRTDGLDGDPSPAARELFGAAALASQAQEDHGDPTEIALVRGATALGIDPGALRAAEPVVAPYPFDSFRKRMTLVRTRDGHATAYVKGAPRETLALCSTLRRGSGSVPLDDDMRRRILADHDRLAAEGLRILAVAVRPLPADLTGAATRAVEQDLTLLGLVALWDPPRPEVADAVALCRRAGIRIVLVTGDYGLTARAIAQQIGLAVETIVTGDEIDRAHPEALRRLVATEGVLFARTSPAHKLAIVGALKALGELVAVTGDGVNDAPALKRADIGIAMGRRGSDVAREAAVMVLADDNFASIVTAVRQGRAIYANLGKFVRYIFASNVPELVPALAFVFAGVPLPLTVMQILAVDLGTDLLPALALGAEAPEPGIMDRPPRRRDERLLSAGRLGQAYGFLGVLEAVLALLAFFWTYWLAGWRPGAPMAATGELYRRATTMTLAAIVASQIGNVFACRTERESVLRVGLASNRLVLLGVAAEVGLLLVLLLVPPLPRIFGLVPPRFAEWGILLAFPPLLLLLEEGRKWIVRTHERSRGTRRRSRRERPVPAGGSRPTKERRRR